MSKQDEDGSVSMGAEGLQIKQRIANSKTDVKTEMFDVGVSMLGTDNEAAAPPDPDGMAQARKAPKP